MDVRPSQLLRVSPASPVSPGSRYRQGQLVAGTVIKWLGKETASVEIEGRAYIAKVDISLKAGVRYPFQVVKEETNGHLQLKVVTRDGSSKGNLAADVLRQWGLPINSRSKDLLGQMMEKGWPLTPSFVKETLELTRDLPQVKDAVSIMEEIMARDLPLNPQIFKALKAVKLGPDSVSLLNKLEELLQDTQSGEGLMEEHLAVFIRNLQSTSISEARVPTPSLPQLLEKMGFFHEAMLARLGSHSQEQLEALSQYGQKVKTLKGELLSFLQASGEGAGHSEFTQTAQQLLDHLTGQQLLSLTHDPEWLSLNVQIPIFQNGRQTEANVKWEIKKTPEGGFDSHFCRLVFHVHLSQLKETVLQMVIQNRSVSCTLYTEEKGEWNPIETSAYEEMKSRLNKLNYNLVVFYHRPDNVQNVKQQLFYQTTQMDVSV